MARGPRPVAVLFLVAAFAIVGWATLRPMPDSEYLPPTCILCGPFGGVDFLLNIALFVPLGASLLPVLRHWRRVLLAGLLVTLLIETLQFAVVSGRDAALGDVLANSLGTAAGAWLALRVPAWISPTGAVPESSTLIAAGLAAAVVAASAWLIVPTAPTGPLWVQWTLPRPNLDPFRGRLEVVTLNNVTLRAGVPLLPAAVVNPDSHTTRVHAVISGTPERTRRPAMLIRLASQQQEGLFLGQWGDAAVFRVQTRASRARLRSPTVRLSDAFAPLARTDGSAAPRIEVVASAHRRRLAMHRLDDNGGRVESSLGLTPGLGWTLLLPWTVALGSNWWPATVAWLGVLTLPAAFFAARSTLDRLPNRRAWVAWWPLGLIGAAMLLTPLASGTSQPGLADWGGVMAGILSGLALGRLTRPRP